jgi:hypothetical protein
MAFRLFDPAHGSVDHVSVVVDHMGAIVDHIPYSLTQFPASMTAPMWMEPQSKAQ